MSVRSRILARVVAVTALGWPRATAPIPSAAWPPARPPGAPAKIQVADGWDDVPPMSHLRPRPAS